MEAGGLVDRMSGLVRISGAGFIGREGSVAGKHVVVFESGVGATAAAHGTRALIAGHKPRWVISAGFAGGLDAAVKQGDIVLADRVVDESGRRLDIELAVDQTALSSTRGLHVGGLVTVDHVVRTAEEKQQLAARTGAMAVDMETIAVAEVCRDERVRFLAVRGITDAVDRNLPRDIEYLLQRKTTAGRLGAAARALVRRPASIKDLWQLKEDALKVSERLGQFLVGVIGQLP